MTEHLFPRHSELGSSISISCPATSHFHGHTGDYETFKFALHAQILLTLPNALIYCNDFLISELSFNGQKRWESGKRRGKTSGNYDTSIRGGQAARRVKERAERRAAHLIGFEVNEELQNLGTELEDHQRLAESDHAEQRPEEEDKKLGV